MAREARIAPGPGAGGLALRLVTAIALVLLTYNPHGLSYFHWVTDGGGFGPEQAVAGVLLLIGWVVFCRATWRSLGPVGLALVALLTGSIVWLLASRGILAADSPVVLQDIVLVGMGVALGLGMSWSWIRRRLSGQADVDDVED